MGTQEYFKVPYYGHFTVYVRAEEAGAARAGADLIPAIPATAHIQNLYLAPSGTAYVLSLTPSLP